MKLAPFIPQNFLTPVAFYLKPCWTNHQNTKGARYSVTLPEVCPSAFATTCLTLWPLSSFNCELISVGVVSPDSLTYSQLWRCPCGAMSHLSEESSRVFCGPEENFNANFSVWVHVPLHDINLDPTPHESYRLLMGPCRKAELPVSASVSSDSLSLLSRLLE